MRLIIAGSRELPLDFTLDRLACLIEEAIVHWSDCGWADITEIVSGTARGADRMGEALAGLIGVPVKPFLPDYAMFGRYQAPKIRNCLMAAYGDRLIAVRLNMSGGTSHIIEQMKLRGKPYFVKDLTTSDTGER
jgi:hypothetical protein